ncbi:MAG: family 78 glycoside hydrolase catalytic domain [Mobilitalea sp.]
MQLENKNWVQASTECDAPYFRKTFQAEKSAEAKLAICGLGFYELYINGNKINEEFFIPVTSDYHPRDTTSFLYPITGHFSHRTYYDIYNIGEYLINGKNVIAIALGNGWYNQKERTVEGHQSFGTPKLTFRLEISGKENITILSDEDMCWHSSEVTFNNLFYGEKQDLRLKSTNWQLPDFDDSNWKKAAPAPPHQTEMCISDCPGDKLIRTLVPQKIYSSPSRSIYDAGENISGWVVLNALIKSGETVTIRHADLLTPEGELDFNPCGGINQIQTTEYIGNGKAELIHPKFSWQAFRYYEITGEFEGYGDTPLLCSVIHADIKQTSSFHCSNETLNWLYDAYIRTQLTNIHAGVPLETPDRERLGYTGDGHLGCQTAMLTLDVQKLYKKWIQDILDCQDKITGRVQHTAPFQGGGGGPAGWGAAIVEIPYQYYLHYQDITMLHNCFAPMLRWFDYLESRSEEGLIVCGEPGGWCLGEWNTPQEVSIPAPFVNTYFYIKSLLTAAEIAKILDLTDESLRLLKKAEQKKVALKKHFYNAEENSYCRGIQAADAFAADIGLGNKEMLHALNHKYSSKNEFDTGIFGTDILLRVLFENGFAQTAYHLLTSDGTASYETMRKGGATTLLESWTDKHESRNHPMFGAAVRYLFTNLLGIKYYGQKAALIKPNIIDGLDYAEGMLTTVNGIIEVNYIKVEGTLEFTINIPNNMNVVLEVAGKLQQMKPGKNHTILKIN